MDRFWDKVDTSGTCWLWTAAKSSTGYGTFWHAGRNTSAHRFVWQAVNGPVPPGMHVMHRCDTPACVNPDHLALGTRHDNMGDAGIKGRMARGERHHMAIFTERDVQIIRLLCGRLRLNRCEVARRYGVSRGAIYDIVTRRNWAHVPDLRV